MQQRDDNTDDDDDDNGSDDSDDICGNVWNLGDLDQNKTNRPSTTIEDDSFSFNLLGIIAMHCNAYWGCSCYFYCYVIAMTIEPATLPTVFPLGAEI